MKKKIIFTLIFLIFLSGQPVTAQTVNPNPPVQTQKLVFVHASVGWRWLLSWLGGWQTEKGRTSCYGSCLPYWDISLGGNNYNVRDYSTNVGHPTQVGHGYCDWYDVFTDQTNLQMLFDYNVVDSTWEGEELYDPLDPSDTSENDIIMIKPCFIDYPIYGNPNEPPSGVHDCSGGKTVGNVKQVLIDILEVFRLYPDKFFVLVTAPPLPLGHNDDVDQDVILYGANARAVADWMVHNWLDGYDVGNVMVFDLYNVLTSNAEGEGDTYQEPIYGNPDASSDVFLETGNHHRIWNNQIQHQQEYQQEYSAYYNGDPHPPNHAMYKMTREFVPLLNAHVNAWLAQTPLPTAMPTPAVATPTPIPTPTPVPGDVNGDNQVNWQDALAVLNNWLTANLGADINNDGKVNGLDAAVIIKNWGTP